MTDREQWQSQPEGQGSADTRPSSYWQGTYHRSNSASSSSAYRDSLDNGAMSPQQRALLAAEAQVSKDHVSAGLLAIFLGVFGIHKFYLGYNQAGFIMLAVSIIGGILTIGLAVAVVWVISLIEGIIYLTKSQTEFDRIYVLDQHDWF